MVETTGPTATRTPLGRRLLGAVLAILAPVVAAGFVAGAWNPWRLVLLRRYFGDPLLGAVLVVALTAGAFWLLAPVRSEATQAGRQLTRWALVAAIVPGLICFGIGHSHFDMAYREIATSPNGHLHAAFVTHNEDRQLRIWVGSGLRVRDAGRAGSPCGPVTVRLTDDLLHISSNYGDLDIGPDPKTGRPLNPMGPTCTG